MQVPVDLRTNYNIMFRRCMVSTVILNPSLPQPHLSTNPHIALPAIFFEGHIYDFDAYRQNEKKRCLRLFSFDIYTDFYTICNEEQLKALFHYPGK